MKHAVYLALLCAVWMGGGFRALPALAGEEGEHREAVGEARGAPGQPAVSAQPRSAPPRKRAAPSAEEEYFAEPNPELTPQERAALAIAQGHQKGLTPGSSPVAGPDGSIRYLFGAEEPSIVCAVLQVCDVTLQPGETVNDVKVGDPRWIIEPAVTGSGASAVVHLILKPADVALNTSLVVTTNRRTYHLRLRSHRERYMSHVSFTYPEEALAKWETVRAQAEEERAKQEIPETRENVEQLSFAYRIDGTALWKPIRVYNDGVRTVIQMPTTFLQMEAPSFLVVRKESALFSSEETVLVNYRVLGSRYIVDSVFDKAILIVGVGRGQQRVTITRLRGGE